MNKGVKRSNKNLLLP